MKRAQAQPGSSRRVGGTPAGEASSVTVRQVELSQLRRRMASSAAQADGYSFRARVTRTEKKPPSASNSVRVMPMAGS